jgi:RNA recognition motif-containing protein
LHRTTAEAAKAAINWFNNTEFMGAKIKVEIAQRKVQCARASPSLPARAHRQLCTRTAHPCCRFAQAVCSHV